MRPIKFRAWNGTKIVPVVFLNFEKQEAQVEATRTEPASSGNTYTSYKWISFDNVMQFTGLLDKNGKEIYEGDILRWWVKSIDKFSDDLLEIVQQGTGFTCKSSMFKGGTCGTDQAGGYMINSEIIGNIYENPDLLPN